MTNLVELVELVVADAVVPDDLTQEAALECVSLAIVSLLERPKFPIVKK